MWGGDATLLFFHGTGHAERACRAAYEMQAVMRREGGLETSRGPLRLRMSVGIHSGAVDFLLVGSKHRELVVTGPAATVLTRMEKVAGPGQIVVSPATADALGAAGQRRPTVAVEDGLLLSRRPDAEQQPAALLRLDYTGVDIGVSLCGMLREHILGGGLDREHRHVAIGFLEFSGVDRLLATRGPDAVLEAVEHVIDATEAAASSNEVTFLATDIGANGGKVMLSAGAPRRAGQDEDRMIATLRAVIDAGGILALRAGVNSGRAFTGDYGPPYRRTYSAMGDCVNLTARLMAHAGEGELLGTAQILEAATGSFAAIARAPFAVKGKSRPVIAFSIDAPIAPRQLEARDRTPMIGREQELAVLLAAERAATAGTGQVVEIVGPPGIGKSRLLSELQSQASVDVLWTDGDIYAQARPYAPFERLLRARWEIPPGTAPEVLAERLQAVTRERAPHLVPWLPLIALVGAIELPSTPEVQQIDPTVRKQRLEEVTSEWLGAVLAGPTVLIFDDLQLMDDASTDLIRRLASDAHSRPWLVIVSRRPGSHAFPAGGVSEMTELGPLSASAAEHLLAGATEAAPLPPHKLAAVAQRAGGNPLFLHELVAQVSAGGDAEALPQSVEDAIAARIDRLTPADRRTLRSAAVLGVVVEAPLLEEVLGADAESYGRRGDPLSALSEFLERLDQTRWRFPQQLVREVAYEGLPFRRRTELHARTAAAIERIAGPDSEQQADLLSLHCLYGAQYEAAWRYSRLAAERARARYALADATESYRRALAAAAQITDLEPSELSEVDEALGDLYVDLGELAAADTALRRAHRLVRASPTSAARLELKLARLREVSGRYVAALRWVQRADAMLAGLESAEARRIRAQLTARRARVRYRQGRHADALAAANAAIALGRRDADLGTLAEALEYAVLASMELGLPAGPRADEALAIYEQLGDLGAAARVHNTLGMLAYHQGHWAAALEQYRSAEDTYTRAGRRWYAAGVVANSAEILADQGRLAEAEAEFERAMLVWRGVNAAPEVAFGEYQLGRIAARTGRGDEAMRRFEAAREHFHAAGELTEVVVVDALTAECLSITGRHSEALALAGDALAHARALGGVHSATPLLQRVRGAALRQARRLGEAEIALRDGLAAARSRDARHEIAFTLGALLESGMAAGAGEEAAWREESSTIAGELGLEL